MYFTNTVEQQSRTPAVSQQKKKLTHAMLTEMECLKNKTTISKRGNSICGTTPDTTTHSFERISSFPVYLNSDIANETVAEIVAATDDGNTLIQ